MFEDTFSRDAAHISIVYCSEDDEEADIQFESSGFISAMQEMFG